MLNHVFVVSEWLPKPGCEQALWDSFKALLATTLNNEKGCIRAHVTKQIQHPGATGKSKYTIVLLQEYESLCAFDIHCASAYVAQAFKELLENPDTALIADWQCRLFSEADIN